MPSPFYDACTEPPRRHRFQEGDIVRFEGDNENNEYQIGEYSATVVCATHGRVLHMVSLVGYNGHFCDMRLTKIVTPPNTCGHITWPHCICEPSSGSPAP